jgi:multiple sugar transport system ATP-binding protein
MREELIRLHHLLAVTTVYVTHDQVEAMTMGDRVAVMDSGRLLQVGTPNDLYENPRDLFVGTFLGAPKMNIFDGQLARTGDGLLALQALGICIALTAHQADKLLHLNSSRVTVGLRPSDLHIPLDAPPSCSISLNGVTDIVEHLGAESIAMVAVAGASLKARVPRSSGIKFHDSVELRFNASDLYFFDKESGESLVQRFASNAKANQVSSAGLADTALRAETSGS